MVDEARSEDATSGQASAPEGQAGGAGTQAELTLPEQLEQARAQAEQYRDNWQRAAADFQNFKRRTEQERSEWHKYANAVLIARLLPVLDDFERALQTVPPEMARLSWAEGLFLIDRKLQAVLEQEGLKPIEALGQTFDPRVHEAVLYEEGAQGQADKVVAELQKGYRLHDRVLRPTMVKVARE